MQRRVARQALGRGLSALISSPVPINRTSLNAAEESLAPDSTDNQNSSGIVSYVPLSQVRPNPTQPRQHFAEQELNELASSIRTMGVLQPLLLRRVNDGFLEIVAGERRWRASQRAGLVEVPAIVRDSIDDKTALELALIENIQRENLNPIEEARGYERLAEDFRLTQAEISERVGKDRATIANLMRLLKLPAEVIQLVKDGKLSMGHARAILTVREPTAQLSLAKKVLSEELSVRALEAIVSRVVVLDSGRPTKGAQGGRDNGKAQNAPFGDTVDRLRNVLGTKVVIRHHPSGKGKLEIDYFSEQELDRIVEKICG